MARKNHKTKPHGGNKARLGDGINNAMLRLGGDTRNAFASSTYMPTNARRADSSPTNLLTNNRAELEYAYLNSWVASLAIDTVAEDMTREGIDITTESPEDEARINRLFERLKVWESLCTCIKWGRLYGGALGVIMIDGEDMSEPLNIDAIRPKSFKGVFPIDRWQVQPSTDCVQTLGQEFGLPKYYTVTAGSSLVSPEGAQSLRIHHSRVIRFLGRPLPWLLAQSLQGWGASVLESFFNRVKAYDLASEGCAQLIQKAHLRFYQVEGLRDVLAMDSDSPAFQGLVKQFDFINLLQSIEGLTVGDKEDVFSSQTYTFTGLPEVLLSFAQQISGAIQVPLVRLLGQSPAGMNSTGESDLRTYYDGIRYRQENTLRAPLVKLLNVAYKSLLGHPCPEGFSFAFRSLWQLSDEQKSTVTMSTVTALMQALDAGAINVPCVLKELKGLSETVGTFSTIDEEMIKDAEEAQANDEPPDPTEGMSGLGNPPQGESMNEGEASNGATLQERNAGEQPRKAIRETPEENR